MGTKSQNTFKRVFFIQPFRSWSILRGSPLWAPPLKRPPQRRRRRSRWKSRKSLNTSSLSPSPYLQSFAKSDALLQFGGSPTSLLPLSSSWRSWGKKITMFSLLLPPSSSFWAGRQCRTEIRTHVLRTFCGFVVGDSKHENPYFCLYIFPFFSGSPSEFPRTVYAYTLYRAPVHKLPFSKVSLVFKLSNSQSILAILKFGRLALNSLTKKTRFT